MAAKLNATRWLFHPPVQLLRPAFPSKIKLRDSAPAVPWVTTCRHESPMHLDLLRLAAIEEVESVEISNGARYCRRASVLSRSNASPNGRAKYIKGAGGKR